MKPILLGLFFSFATMSCQSHKKAASAKTPAAKVESLEIAHAQLLQVKNATLLVLSIVDMPYSVDRCYVLQGARSKEDRRLYGTLHSSENFVIFQSRNDYWVLTLSKDRQYKQFLPDGANVTILKGSGLAKYIPELVGYDDFIEELKAGKHDDKF